MPTPTSGESESDFVSRCIPIVMGDGTAENNEQAAAICYSIFREGKAMNHLKVLDDATNEDELVLEGYLALFGGDDLTGERFTKSTQFDSDYTRLDMVAIDWEHGMKPDGKSSPGVNDLLGRVDWQSTKMDDNGLLVRRILDRRNRYVKEIVEPLARAGLLGSSSEAVAEGVQKSDDGTIKIWPIKRDSLTVTPAEPRLLTEHQMQVVKSLADEYPALKSYVSNGAQDSAVTTDNEPENVTIESIGDIDMTEEIKSVEPVNYDDIIAAAAAKAAEQAVEAYQAQLDNEAAPKKGAIVTGDSADRALEGNPFKTAGEFYMEVKKAGQGKEFDERIYPLQSTVTGEGIVYQLPQAAVKAMKAPTGLSELVPADGGFLVGTDRQTDISMRSEYMSQVWNRAFNLPIGPNSNGTTLNMVDETSRADGSRWGGVRGYWIAEASEKTASKPTFDQIEPKLKKVVALVYATDEVLQDATQLGALLSVLPRQELEFQKDDKAINGSGVGVPLGILNSPALVSQAKETGQAAATVVAENIIKMYSRREGSAANYVWFINQEVEPQLHQLNLPVGTGGALVYMPPGGLSASPYGSLYGRPVIPIEQAAALGTVGDIMFVNMMKYLTISKGGVQQAESIHVRFIYDESVFRFVERVDGQPMVKSALTPYKGSATRSPFVALATRS